ncbi:ABC transporter E family member 2-like isoform X1 [Salvia splendens]|uniref:ABC transporter E family member 2-like isoform X1 n=1 Tax=Salvia splendens TaxID=180675 RepID=UPI001103A7DB|nr:ABC transporter E family member 2-like isoform X1 [Salvia splendens]
MTSCYLSLICIYSQAEEIRRVSDEQIETGARHKYPSVTVTQRRKFKLKVMEGEFSDSGIIVLLGENGTGKTTFLRILAGIFEPRTVECDVEIPKFNVSFKSQNVGMTAQLTVKSLLFSRIRDSYMDPQFVSDVMKPLLNKNLMDKKLQDLSNGELQRVSIVACIGKPADLYLIDEPSKYLDAEQSIIHCFEIIKKFIQQVKKTALVEHDFTMATYLADRVMVFEGKPSVDCVANPPQSVLKWFSSKYYSMCVYLYTHLQTSHIQALLFPYAFIIPQRYRHED